MYILLAAAMILFTISVLLSVGTVTLIQLVPEKQLKDFVMASPRLVVLPLPAGVAGAFVTVQAIRSPPPVTILTTTI